MYQGPVSTMRRASEEDDRQRTYQAHSPTHAHPYSPSNRTRPQSPPNPYSSRPSSSTTMSLQTAISPRLGPPASPKTNGSSQQPSLNSVGGPSTSTRYDPLADHRETITSRKQSLSHTRSPTQVRPPSCSLIATDRPLACACIVLIMASCRLGVLSLHIPAATRTPILHQKSTVHQLILAFPVILRLCRPLTRIP